MKEKASIKKTVDLLQKLDSTSLLIIQSGAQMLVARQMLDEVDQNKNIISISNNNENNK